MMPGKVDAAPFLLHRIPEELIYHEADASKSQTKRDKSGHCCITTDGNIPILGISWDAKNDFEAKGVSTFSPFDSNDAAMEAAHNLFDEENNQLDCRILPQGVMIQNTCFVYDRDFPGQNPCAHHVLITPSAVVRKDYFDSIGQCIVPENAWQMCPYVLKAGGSKYELELPEPPDDALLCLACNALEDFALDWKMPSNTRRATRLAQFSLSPMTTWTELRNHAFLSSLVHQALSRWQEGNFDGFPVATKGMIRGMIEDVAAWSNIESNIERTPFQLPAVRTYASVCAEALLSAEKACPKYDMLLYADNLDSSAPVDEEAKFSLFSLGQVAERCLEPLKMYLNSIIEHDVTSLARVGSLAVVFQNVPDSVLTPFIAYLEADASHAEDFVAILVEQLQEPKSIAPTVLSIVTAPKLTLSSRSTNDYNPTSKYVSIAVLRVQGLALSKALHTCVAIGKYISLVRDTVWRKYERVMVMCMSEHHSIELSGIIPGNSDASVHSRRQLFKRLQQDVDMKDWLRSSGENFTIGPVCLGNDQVFFLFSFNQDLHLKALLEMKSCLKRLHTNFNVVKDEILVNIEFTSGRG